MNRLYTLEGENNSVMGNPFARLLKFPSTPILKFSVPKIPVPRSSIVRPKINIPRPKINIPRPKINIPRSTVNPPKVLIPKIKPPVFPSAKISKNPFSSNQKVDKTSSYMDFYNELESRKQENFSPEPNYPENENLQHETNMPQIKDNFTQEDIQNEINQTPVYGYDYNDLMVGAIKLPKLKIPKIKIKTKPKISLGRKKPTLLQKLTLKPGSSKSVKIRPKEIKAALAVTGAVAGTVLTAGAALPAIAAIGGGSLMTGAGVVASGSALGSTLFATGSPTVSSALSTAGALLNNPAIQENVPIANSANEAINTGLNYYNTGAGIAESLGLTPPSLGTNSQELFSLLGKGENRALSEGINEEMKPPVIFKDPVNDPTHPLYILPPVTGKSGQTGQTDILTTDKTKKNEISSNIGLIIGIGFLGYLFINKKKGKK